MTTTTDPILTSCRGDPEEVTDERIEGERFSRQIPVFHWPNKITEKDFEGWIEERGSKFLQSWDPAVHGTARGNATTRVSPSRKAGLMYARYGKGVYVYNAYAFYQASCRLGVPGAVQACSQIC